MSLLCPIASWILLNVKMPDCQTNSQKLFVPSLFTFHVLLINKKKKKKKKKRNLHQLHYTNNLIRFGLKTKGRFIRINKDLAQWNKVWTFTVPIVSIQGFFYEVFAVRLTSRHQLDPPPRIEQFLGAALQNNTERKPWFYLVSPFCRTKSSS